MRIAVLLAIVTVMASSGYFAAAQGNDFRWSGALAPNKTIDIRATNGSVRAIVSVDRLVHVVARYIEPADALVQVVEHDRGVTVCATSRVEFEVRVPPGVHLTASLTEGDIDVERLRSDVTVSSIGASVRIESSEFTTSATSVSGNVLVSLPRDANAYFHATTVRGTIDSDFAVLPIAPLPPAPMRLPDGRQAGPSIPLPPQIVGATIGRGGPELRVTTVSGNIRLRQR